MRTEKWWWRWFILVVLIGVILVGCRRQEEEATPTAVSPTTESTTPVRPTPTLAPTAVPAPTEPVIAPEAIDWPPQVVYVSPAPGEEVTLDGAITIRFDQPMDQASVERALRIEPVEGGTAVTGTFTWPRPDTLVFVPQSQLKREQTYRVRLTETAVSQKGQRLSDTLDVKLQTVGFLQVSQVIPADNTTNVQPDSAITVFFNRPVVPLVTTSQQMDLPQPLQFTPPVSGQGRWVSSSIYRFVPDEPLAGGATYRVEIPAGLTDMTGGELAESFVWQFTTDSPRVVRFEPSSGLRDVIPSRPITITFNMPMERGTTETAVRLIRADGTPENVTYQWSDDSRQLTLVPQPRLQLNTQYRLEVSASARAAGGNATLAQPVSLEFTTVPLPAVAEVYPRANSQAEFWDSGVSITFASPMDPDTLQDRIRIDPPPKRVSYFFGDDNRFLRLEFTHKRNTEYTITIPGDAADPYGNTLGEDFVWSFQSAGFMPVASFNLPFGVSQISTAFPSNVEIIHRNVSVVDVSLYDVGLQTNLLFNRDLFNFSPGSEPIRTWSLQFDTAQDELGTDTLSLANGGTLPTGVYFLRLRSGDLDPDSRFWQNQRHLLVVADTNLVVREMPEAVWVWVTDLETAAPVLGRIVTLYGQNGQPLGTAVTDVNGIARFDYQPGDYLDGVLAVTGQPGQPGFGVAGSNWTGGLEMWAFGLENYVYAPELDLSVYLYTDRPIYRPGDTIYYKGIVRDADYGRYSLPAPQQLTLRLSPRFFVGADNQPQTFTVMTNEDGVFSGEITLPEDMPTGSYALAVEGQSFASQRTISVAEYRKPEFLVTLTPDKLEALRGESVQVELDASFFFGAPAADMQVTWSVYRRSYSPDVPGEFYAFGDFAGFFEDEFSFGFPGFGAGGETYLIDGSGVTDENGRLLITLPADLLADVAPGSQVVTVEATVTDLAETPVAGRTEIIFHAADGYVGIRPESYLVSAGETASVALYTVDWNGRSLPNQSVDLVFYRREWRYSRELQFGQYVTVWESEDTEVARQSVTTDAEGKATASFVPEEGGSYIAVATLTDGNGRTQTSSTYIWVIQPGFFDWRSDPKIHKMELTTDKTSYAVGETARVLVQSPFATATNAWVTIERGNVIESWLVRLQGGSEVLEIPIRDAYAPNVYVTITAIKPVDRNDSQFPFADIRIGVVELVVPPDRFELNVSLVPRADQFRPGETAVYDIRVTNSRGAPVQAELSLALVDLAVLTLKEDTTPSLLDYFYGRQPYVSQIGSGLLVSGEGIIPEEPSQVLGLGGGGGGDFAPETAVALRNDDEEEAEIRRDFPDTAYWNAHIQTDRQGRATVEIPLPDSLTTWRLRAKAITLDTLVGESEVDVIVGLPLLLRPVTPRFFTVGDLVQIGAFVHNNTSSDIEAAVTLEVDGLTLASPATQTVPVPANGRTLVQWDVAVNNVDFADLTFRVAGGGFRDATKPTFGVGPDQLIPVYRYNARDFVGSAGVLTADDRRRVEAVLLPEHIDRSQGEVEIWLNASLAGTVLDAVDYLDALPYEPSCSSAISGRLLSNAVAARAIRQLALDRPDLLAALDEVIPQQIDDLQMLQLVDGGWGWCYSNQSNEYMSAYALLALLKAKEAGYGVDPAVLERGARYVRGRLRDPERIFAPYVVNQQAFILYVLALAGEDVRPQVDTLLTVRQDILSSDGKGFLLLAYGLMGVSGGGVDTLLANLNGSAVVSAGGVHWEDVTLDVRHLNTDIRGTAVILDALLLTDPDNPLAVGAARWLVAARTAVHWQTVHDTTWVLLALTDWMTVTKELEGEFDYRLFVNTREWAQGRFSAANVTDTEVITVPIRELMANDLNLFDLQRGDGNGRLYYTMHLNSFIPAERVSTVSRGISIERVYYDADCDPEVETCMPIDQIAAGEQVRVQLTIIVPHNRTFVVIEDPIPAGTEGIDPTLDITTYGFNPNMSSPERTYQYGYWGWWFFDRIEFRDEKVRILANSLPAGTYQYTYYLQARIPGSYQVMPAVAFEEFFPDVFGRSDGQLFTIVTP